MLDTMIDESQGCTPDDGTSNRAQADCGSWLAMPYFISFMLIGVFVLLNLVLAIVLEKFLSVWQRREESEERGRRSLPPLVSTDDVHEFAELWAEYDPDASGKLHVVVLPQLMVRLRPPLGLACDNATTMRATRRLLIGATQYKQASPAQPSTSSAVGDLDPAEMAQLEDSESGAAGRGTLDELVARVVADEQISAEAVKLAGAALERCRHLQGSILYDRATPTHVGFRGVLHAFIRQSFEGVCDVTSLKSLLREAQSVAHQKLRDLEVAESYRMADETLRADLLELEAKSSGTPRSTAATKKFTDLMGAMHDYIASRPTSWLAALKSATTQHAQPKETVRIAPHKLVWGPELTRPSSSDLIRPRQALSERTRPSSSKRVTMGRQLSKRSKDGQESAPPTLCA
jgi:hypothetical protein